MTPGEIKKLIKKYKIGEHKVVQSEQYEILEGETLIYILEEYSRLYQKVEVRAGGDFGYGDDAGYPHFEILGIVPLEREELIAEIERHKEIEFQEKVSKLEKERRAELQLIEKLKKKYPEQFK